MLVLDAALFFGWDSFFGWDLLRPEALDNDALGGVSNAATIK